MESGRILVRMVNSVE